MKQFESWDDLFGHWKREADKYSALIRLHKFYDQQSETISEPFRRKLLEYVEKHGAVSLTPEVRDSIYSEIRDEMNELKQWFDRMTKEIINYFDSKETE